MGRIKRGGYLIEWSIGDQYPKHIHIYKDGKQVAKVQVPGLLVLSGKLSARLRKILTELVREKII